MVQSRSQLVALLTCTLPSSMTSCHDSVRCAGRPATQSLPYASVQNLEARFTQLTHPLLDVA